MDVVLGVSVDPGTVRMVIAEGVSAGGVTVDQDAFRVGGGGGAVAAADQVVEAVLGMRESAARGGYRLASIGVTSTAPAEAAAVRNGLAAHKIGGVTLVSALTAAAALAQAVGSATRCARTALLFVEPGAATLAVAHTSDGSIADVHRRPLPHRHDAARAELAALAAEAEGLKSRPDAMLLVGTGVDVRPIKPGLDAATSLTVSVPEEPEMALARGAALASANAQLGAPSTVEIPGAQEPFTAGQQLAYSAESDIGTGVYREAAADPAGRRSSRPLLAIVSATVVFVVGAVALAVALAIGIRPNVDQRPEISKNVVAPATQAPPPPSAAPPPAPPQQAPASEAPAPGPGATPPRQWTPPRPKDDNHDGDDWLRRHLGHGILVP